MSGGAKDESSRVPGHLAIIMDGNGRWARDRGLSRIRGHEKGADSVREITEECARIGGIRQLTLYALSHDNLRRRPQREIRALFRLLDRYLRRELPTILENNIRFQTIGEIEEFPKGLRRRIAITVDESAANTGLVMCLALNYSSRREIARAARLLAREVAEGRLIPDDIDVAAVGDRLYTAAHPAAVPRIGTKAEEAGGDVDLLIRTGGNLRVSDFLLWQISYAEIWVIGDYWPDFRVRQLHEALDAFAERKRRFGAVKET